MLARVLFPWDRTRPLMTWTGTRIHETLRAIFATGNTEPEDESIALVFSLPRDRAVNVIKKAATVAYTEDEIARLIQARSRRKYDWLLDDELITICTARGWVDLSGASALLATFC